ncbi:MAG: hypothetical protein ACR2N5_05475, partial [Solirubrobacterales bacterium]
MDERQSRTGATRRRVRIASAALAGGGALLMIVATVVAVTGDLTQLADTDACVSEDGSSGDCS